MRLRCLSASRPPAKMLGKGGNPLLCSMMGRQCIDVYCTQPFKAQRSGYVASLCSYRRLLPARATVSETRKAEESAVSATTETGKSTKTTPLNFQIMSCN